MIIPCIPIRLRYLNACLDLKHDTHILWVQYVAVGADILAWYWWESIIEFVLPSGILREPEGSIINGNIWLMGRITDTVQFIIS